jgi:7-cyano-7-deazaguanine reductase
LCRTRLTRSFPPIPACLFVMFLLLSNIIAGKLIPVFGPVLPAAVAVILFPLSYLFGDVLTEVYGCRKPRLVIWAGFICAQYEPISFGGVTMTEFKALGQQVREPGRNLETFAKPAGVTRVVMESDEFTSLCPVTGQPDWSTVIIEYAPRDLCIESKSLKLYLWSFRDEGAFCEALADRIADDVCVACQPAWCRATVVQKPRGGIKITSVAEKSI